MEGNYFEEGCRTPSCTKKSHIIWVKMISFEKIMKQSYPIHALHLWATNEKILWYQQLVHTCDQLPPLPMSAIMLIPSLHTWLQAQIYPARTLLIFFITKNLKHPSFDAIFNLQRCLILTRVLPKRVKDIPECHIIPYKDIYK